jgi:hypothetical protein
MARRASEFTIHPVIAFGSLVKSSKATGAWKRSIKELGE